MSRPAITDLATRLQVDVYAALEDYEGRAAIRQHLGGMSQGDAEIAAVGDVEAMIKARPFALAVETEQVATPSKAKRRAR